jgi:hypothetical protein
MTFSGRTCVWAIAALGVGLTACGGGGNASPLDLKTPGANTGDPSAAAPKAAATPAPTASPSPTPTPTATPKPQGGPVTAEEERIIRSWANELRHGHVAAASRYFSVPALVANDSPTIALATIDDVQGFNSTLPCGAKLVATRRSVARFVVGTFVLTDRPGGACGSGTGQKAEVAFLIHKHLITQWMRVPDPEPDATPTPAPTVTDPETT